MCINYRKVNYKKVKDWFLMCVVSEYVYSMNKIKMYTKIDLVSGYYQMPVVQKSQPITEFPTTKNHLV